MAVSISIEGHPETSPLVFKDDDPIYWFLYPYFEATYRELGQMVDLSGNTEFFAEELLAFFLMLENAELDARSRDSQWAVTIGHNGKDGTPVQKSLAKSAALERIESLKQMLNDAYNMGKRVVCFGD